MFENFVLPTMVLDVIFARVPAKFFVPFQGFVREIFNVSWPLQLFPF
jgi:hypothetical protein